MKAYRLDSMPQNAIAFDLETHLVQPGLLAPPLVLGSAAELGQHEWLVNVCKHCRGTRGLTPEDRCIRGEILTKHAAREVFRAILQSPQTVICGANIAYDMLVEAVDFAKRGVDIMPEIMAMYDPEGTIVRGDCDGRVFEIQLAEPLHAIAQGHLGQHALSGQPILSKNGRKGRYSLDAVTFEVLGREDAKANDRFRLKYAQFDDVPLEQLPYEAWKYPIDDACNTLEDALAQAGHLPSANVHEWAQSPVGGLYCTRCNVAMTPDAPQACMRLQRRRNLHALAPQAYFAWAAHLGSAWGFHVPQDAVDALEKRVDDAREADLGPFKEAGIVRDNGTEDQSVLKRLVAVAYGARDICPECAGEGKVPSPATNGKTKINCKACDGTKLHLPPEVPRSEGGGVSKNRDTLFESGNELLMDYAEQPSKKIKTTYIPLLRRGRACNVCGSTGCATKYKKAHEDWCTAPNGEAGYREIPLCPHVDPLKETLRASVEDGLHGIPRKGGIRECIQARPGYVLSSVDWAAGELMTLAQSAIETVGYSRLADALNKNLDVHLALAGTLAGKSYDVMLAAKKAHEKWVDPFRQVGKKSNFGFGGRMGELTFVLKPCRGDTDLFTPCEAGPLVRNLGTKDKPKYVRGYAGVRPCIMLDGADHCGGPGEMVMEYYDRPCPPVCKRCLAAGKRAREAWYNQWPEMREFHAYVKAKSNGPVGPSGTFEINYPGITRGGLDLNNATNGYFQIRLAQAAKAAFCQIQRECLDRTWRVRSSEMMQSKYEGCESPLYGSRAILLFHDETICEHPESVASDGAKRSSEIMIETLRFSCPALYQAIAADPALIRALYKGAEPVWQDGIVGGDLLVWEPKS